MRNVRAGNQMNKYLIYKHTSPSGKSYIGQTNDMRKRTNAHKSKKGSGCKAFRSAILKYGWDSFTHEVIANNLTLEQANVLEARYITEHNTLVPNGYNLMTGGYNSTHTEETKRVLSEKNTGRILSVETKNKMSESKKGVKLSDEQRKINTDRLILGLSIAREKAIIANTGAKRTEEQKLKMSKAAVGRKHSLETLEKMRQSAPPITQETREKMRLSQVGRKVTEVTKLKLARANTGKKHSPETLAKMRESQVRRRSLEKCAVR